MSMKKPKRLLIQVLVDKDLMKRVKAEAEKEHLTVSSWLRRLLALRYEAQT